jgi:hypothetical protein
MDQRRRYDISLISFTNNGIRMIEGWSFMGQSTRQKIYPIFFPEIASANRISGEKPICRCCPGRTLGFKKLKFLSLLRDLIGVYLKKNSALYPVIRSSYRFRCNSS